MKKLLTLFLLITATLSFPNAFADKKPLFKDFMREIRQEAIRLGVTAKTAHRYLDSLRLPQPTKKTAVVRLQQHQAQAVLTLDEYYRRLVPGYKKKIARHKLKEHRALFKKINQKFQVQPQYIIALWGLESNFGRDTGNFPLVRSLAILAYHHHRSSFYRRQLIDALFILDGKHVIPPMKKSAFDGGMGQPQFEPSAYLHYAVDFNGDGFKNIWTNTPDALASIANFLHRNGWNGQQSWGIRVTIPHGFNPKKAGRKIWKPVSHWQALGVRQHNGKALPNVKGDTALLLPNGKKGPYYLVYPNFKVLLRWNNTTFESLATGRLADEIIAGSS